MSDHETTEQRHTRVNWEERTDNSGHIKDA